MKNSKMLDKSIKNISIINIIILLIILISALIYKFYSLIHGLNVIDEGIFLHGTENIMSGMMPHKDFFVEYMPGRFYLLSLFFGIFGISVLALKIMNFVVLIITSVIVYFLSKKIIKNKLFAIFPSLLIVFFSWNVALERHLFSLMAFLTLFYIYDKRKMHFSFIPGILTGIAFLFSQDLALYTFLCSLLFILIINIKLRYSKRLFIWNHFKKFIKQSILFLIGFFLIILPYFYYYYVNGALSNMIYDIFIYPLFFFKLALPYPSILSGLPNGIMWFFRGGFIFYLPFLIYILTAIILIKDWHNKKLNKSSYYLLIFFVFGLFLIKNLSVRSDYSHLKYILIPIYIMGMYLLYRLFNYIKQFYPKLAYILLIFPLLFVIQWPVYDVVYAPYNNCSFLNISRGQIYVGDKEAIEIKGVVDYIQENTEKDGSFFVVPYYPIFYFLSDRNNPTKYDYFFLGVLNEDKEEAIVSLIDKERINYILYGNVWNVDGKKFSDYNKILHSYIIENYFVEKKIGRYDILRRKI